MKNNFLRILVICVLAAIVLGSLFMKGGTIYIPGIYSLSFKSFHSLISKLTDTGSNKKTDGAAGSFHIQPPDVMAYYESENGELKSAAPDPILFLADSSAANIEKIGSALENITMSPKAEGVWEWKNEYTLSFTPKNNWPAGEEYKIKFPKDIFNPEFRAAQYSYKVSTPKFKSALSNFSLFQDPKNPKVRQIQAIFSFTHSVDEKSFEKNLKFSLNKKDLKYSVTYDAIKRNAYVVSEQIQILTNDQTAAIELSPVKAASGGKASDKVKRLLDIPSQQRFFKFEDVNSVIIKNDSEDYEQFLSVNFTDGVNAKELDGKTEVYLLPLKNPLKENENFPDSYGETEGYYNDSGEYVEPVRYYIPYSYKWSISEITPEILAQSQKLELELIENPSEISGTYLYRYSAPDLAKRYLYVSIKEGITSQTDFKIEKPYAAVIKSASYPKEVSLIQNGAVLPLNSNMLTFKTRGVNGVKASVSRVMPSQINHLISQTYGDFAHPNFKNGYDFDERNISVKFSKIIPLAASISKANYSSLNMNEFLASQGSSGLFFIDLQAYDPERKRNDGPSDKRFILATDLAMLVKKDPANRHSVFVMSIKNGTPVPNVKVEILGKNGIPVLTRRTDADGCAVFSKVEGFYNERQPVAYVAANGNDISFMPFDRHDRKVNYSKFSVSGEYSSSISKGLKAFIFSDRGIYRPGDNINFAMIVKDESWKDISGIAVKTVLSDPYGKTVFEQTVSLNSSGLTSLDDIKTYNTSPTGTYTLAAYLVKDEKNESFIGSASVRVEEFRTDSIKVSAKITGVSGAGWTIPEDIKALVTANNFFGTPAQNRAVKASYSLTPAEFSFSKFPGFKFPDPHKLSDRNAARNLTEYLENAETGENGDAEFNLDLSKYSGGTYNLSFEAEVFEADSGKSVYAYDEAKASPYKYLAGYKTASKLEYINKGSSVSVNIIAADNNLKQIGLKNLKARVLQKQYISSLVKQNNGVYKYQTSVKETPVSENAFEISEKGSKFALNTSEAGNYSVEIADENENKILAFSYFVAGASNSGLKIEKDASLAINLQSADVKPGSQLTLNITAPYAGSGLITIEKDKLYAYKWFKTNTASAVEKITVPANIEGNAYVNVSFIRSADSKEIFSSPHSYAVVPFKISLAERKIAISLKTPETVKPGDEIEISYKTSQAAKIVVFAADQGILQAAGYRVPSPLDFFFKKTALEVETLQTADLILPDYKIIKEISGIGGGEGFSDMIEKNLNPFARKQSAPAVFWSSVLESSSVYKKVKYKVPGHFNGLLKVMAVAASPDKAGSADKEITVKSPVIISPMAPLAAIPGDSFEVSAAVSNNIEGSKSASIEVWLETNDRFKITSENKQTLEIKEGGEKTVRFALNALDKLGSGDLIFKAKYKDDEYKSEVSVSVKPSNVYQTVIKSGVSNKAKTKIDDFQRDMHDEFSDREITASHSPQIVFHSLKKYFSAYPYGCTEQIVSSVFPFLYGAVSDKKGLISAQEQREMFNNALSKIRVRQQNSGGFALWEQSSSAHPYTTVYTLHFLTDAKDLGYPVPADILSRGKSWLENFASELPESLEDARLKAYANYVLTRNNYITTNNLLRTEQYLNENHKRWNEDITSAYMASCYMLLKDSQKAADLIKTFKPDAKDKFIFYSDYDSSSQRNAVYLYLCGRHFPQNLNPDASAIANGLVNTVLSGKYNTVSSSQILLALLSYGKDLENKDSEINISVKDSDGKETALTLNADPFPYSKFESGAEEFTLNSTGTGKIYYSVIQQGFDKNAKDYANGLEITADYINSNGEQVKTAKLGDVLTARLRIRAKSADFVNIAVVDMLPACFEIISGSQDGSFDSCDAREDRMIFYAAAGKNITELTYKVKIVTKGNFTAPGTYACAMYDPEISALTKQEKFESVNGD